MTDEETLRRIRELDRKEQMERRAREETLTPPHARLVSAETRIAALESRLVDLEWRLRSVEGRPTVPTMPGARCEDCLCPPNTLSTMNCPRKGRRFSSQQNTGGLR